MTELESTTLIAFLGTNDYLPVFYTREPQKSASHAEMMERQSRGATTRTPHKFVQTALLELLDSKTQTNVILLVTDDARHGRRVKDPASGEERRAPSNYSQLEPQLRRSGHAVSAVDIPDGATETELWRIFELVVNAVPEEGNVVFDVTHGFRSLPFVGILGMAFARHTRKANLAGIYYGAFETLGELRKVREQQEQEQKTGVVTVFDAPFFDLSGMFELPEWTEAAAQWRQTGRATVLSGLAKRRQRPQNPLEAQMMAPLRKITDAIGRLDDALILTRQDEISKQAATVVEAIENQASPIADHPEIAPIRLLLDMLKEAALEVGGEVPSDGADSDHTSNHLRIARWYVEHGRLHEGASLASEIVQTLAVKWAARCGVIEPPKPDKRREGLVKLGVGSQEFRKGASDAMNVVSGIYKPAVRPQPPFDNLGELTPQAVRDAFAAASNAIREVRNPLDHCWFGASHVQHTFKRGSLDALVKKLRDALDALALLENAIATEDPTSLLEGATPAGFLNLSNHPVASWSSEQLEAARALGFGEPLDCEPGDLLVDPELDTQHVDAAARKLAARILDRGFRGAHVSGEPVLTHSLVRELARGGVRCYAATTARVSTSIAAPDGSTEVRRTFRFVRWREYGTGRSM